MALYAIDNVDNAFDATRAFLTSIGRRAWLKLAVVALFVGGAGGGFPGFSFPGNGGTTGDTPPDEVTAFDPGPDFWLLVVGVVAVVVAFAVALAVVGAIMEFVFVESLRSEKVSVREYWGRHWGKGVRLFGFRLVVGGLMLTLFGLFAAAFILPFLFDVVPVSITLLLLLMLVFLPVVMVIAVLLGLVSSFTTMFVVPIMILEDRGVIAGWRRLWPTIRAEWKQYLSYAVAAWVLGFAGGMLISIVTAVVGVVLFVPFGFLALIGLGLLSVSGGLGTAWFVVVAALFTIVGLIVLAFAQIPVLTYLRYYALLVLGDVESEFDIIPEQRAAARAGDGADETDDAGESDETDGDDESDEV